MLTDVIWSRLHCFWSPVENKNELCPRGVRRASNKLRESMGSNTQAYDQKFVIITEITYPNSINAGSRMTPENDESHHTRRLSSEKLLKEWKFLRQVERNYASKGGYWKIETGSVNGRNNQLLLILMVLSVRKKENGLIKFVQMIRLIDKSIGAV